MGLAAHLRAAPTGGDPCQRHASRSAAPPRKKPRGRRVRGGRTPALAGGAREERSLRMT
ncbi:MAG: hypothetical protein MUP03_03000 [Anaerolineales bacterium]|nr:hypothetical protein [Anaerolineales bacterium]